MSNGKTDYDVANSVLRRWELEAQAAEQPQTLELMANIRESLKTTSKTDQKGQT